MSVYDDLPLQSTDQTIRLMRFQKANDRNDPLVADLFVVSLDNHPNYAALSYRWGPSESPCRLTCNQASLEVTQNLTMALSSIRSMTTLPLWVDQVCINQDDVSERSAQVSQMKRIYAQATETFVYLGEPDSAATAEACKIFDKIMIPWLSTANWEDGELNGKILPLRTQLAALKLVLKHPRLVKRSYDKDVARAMSQFIEMPYFNRKWIIQEVTVSKSRVCVIGLHRFDWDQFILLALKEGEYVLTAGLSNGLQVSWLFQLVRDFINGQPSSLLRLVYYSRYFKATDPRDHVFALLGAASDANDFPRPDYDTPVEQVYHNVSKCFVKQGKQFLMLHLAGMRATDNGLPSWVVDWRDLDTNYPCKYFTSFCAGGKDGGVKICSDDAIIRTSGKIVDHVVAIGEPFTNKVDLWERLAEYIDNCAVDFERFYEHEPGRLAIRKDLASLVHFDMKYDASCNAQQEKQGMFVLSDDEYDIARCQDYTALDFSTWTQLALLIQPFHLSKAEEWLSGTERRSRTDCLSWLCRKLKPVPTSKSLAKIAVAIGLAKNSDDENMLRFNFFRPTTRPIMTHKRRLGLAPALTRKGDVVCVIFGAKAPFILRPAENGTYKIVGEAYVRDIMFGETLNDEKCPTQEILIC